jgi:hypothetical protein
MRDFPIDIEAFMANMTPYGVAPVVDPETGEQRRDRDGVPKWKLRLIHDNPTDTRKPEFVEVGITEHGDRLNTKDGPWPTFTTLTGRMWEMNGRSGLSVTADGPITFGQPPTASGGVSQAA